MLAYRYDSNNVFVGQEECFLDPEETKIQGKDVWLLAANTTFTKPNEDKEGFVQLWDGKTWKYIENHVGEEGFVNNEPFTIKEYGPYPTGWAKEREKTLDELKSEKIMEIDAKTNELVDKAGLTFDGQHFGITEKDQLKWTKFGFSVQSDFLKAPYKIQTITGEDYVLETKEKALQFVGAVMNYDESETSPRITGEELKEKVNNCKTKEELEKIVDNR